MTTSTVTPEIAEFAQGVRAALADLPAEEVDDLTEGLEADLAEAYAEDLQRELPDPAAYATELRAAAGLPMRTKAPKSGVLSGLVQGWKDTKADIGIAIRRNPALASALDFLEAIRPIWWIVRAWLAAWIVAAFFGFQRGYWFDGVWWIVFAAFVIVSVQWGRGRWHGNGVPALIAVGNVVAVVALLPVLAAADDSGAGSYSTGYEDAVMSMQDQGVGEGLSFNGEPLNNIFAYDASGKLLQNVQLFDSQGRPLAPHPLDDPNGDRCADADCSAIVQPRRLETGALAYNVFPLGNVDAQWDEQTGETLPKPGASVVVPKAPYIKVPAVQAPEKDSKSDK